MTFIQQLDKRQAVGFRLPAAQAKNLDCWDPLPSLGALCHNDFLLPGDLKGSQYIYKMRKEKTLALAKALQRCSKWSGGPYSMICGAARDLQGCMANLMWFEEGDVLEIPLLEPTDDLPIASQTSQEDAALPGEPQETQATAACPPRHIEWAPEPKDVAKPVETATQSQGMQVHPLPPPGSGPLPPASEPPLTEEDDPLIRIPDPEAAHVALTPISAMNMIIFRNELTGNIEYE